MCLVSIENTEKWYAVHVNHVVRQVPLSHAQTRESLVFPTTIQAHIDSTYVRNTLIQMQFSLHLALDQSNKTLQTDHHPSLSTEIFANAYAKYAK
jgi:hypothetical protein